MEDMYITQVLHNNLLDDFTCFYLSIHKLVKANEKDEPVVEEEDLSNAQKYAVEQVQELYNGWAEKLGGEVKIVPSEALNKENEEPENAANVKED